jgi:hypothetical protein
MGASNAVFIFFYGQLLKAAFGLKWPRRILSDLFHKFTYRYSRSDGQSSLAVPRYYYHSLRLLWKKWSEYPQTERADFVVYDGNVIYLEERINYLKGLEDEQPGEYIFRNKLNMPLSFWTRLFTCLHLSVLVLPIWIYSLFHSDKARSAMVLQELTELVSLYARLRQLGTKRVVIFCAHEKDTPLISRFLMKKGIQVDMAPSPNPISFHYKTVICDTYYYTCPFQREEYEELSENWIINGDGDWPPFRFDEVNVDEDPKSALFGIGFISSAMFMRKHLGHNIMEDDAELKAEMALIESLKKYLPAKNLQNDFIVFLHPLERHSEERIQLAKEYYEDVFGFKPQFAPTDQNSRECFELASVAVSGFSSSLFERLFGGYKTIIAPMGKMKSYYKDPRLNSVTAESEEALFEILDEVGRMEPEQFFRNYDLMAYHWKSYLTRFPRIQVNRTSKLQGDVG